MNDKKPHVNDIDWRGYSLDELRCERVTALARIEIEKAKLLDSAGSARDALPILGSTSPFRLFKTISKFDILLITFKLYRKLAPLFKKKK